MKDADSLLTENRGDTFKSRIEEVSQEPWDNISYFKIVLWLKGIWKWFFLELAHSLSAVWIEIWNRSHLSFMVVSAMSMKRSKRTVISLLVSVVFIVVLVFELGSTWNQSVTGIQDRNSSICHRFTKDTWNAYRKRFLLRREAIGDLCCLWRNGGSATTSSIRRDQPTWVQGAWNGSTMAGARSEDLVPATRTRPIQRRQLDHCSVRGRLRRPHQRSDESNRWSVQESRRQGPLFGRTQLLAWCDSVPQVITQLRVSIDNNNARNGSDVKVSTSGKRETIPQLGSLHGIRPRTVPAGDGVPVPAGRERPTILQSALHRWGVPTENRFQAR